MNHAQFLRELCLPETATRRDIQRAFRRAALRLHPDRHADDPELRRRFVELAKAYRTAMRALAARARRAKLGVCGQCRDYTDLYPRMDGRLVCERCLAASATRRFLPLPALVIVRCLPAVCLNLAAAVLLFAAVAARSPSLAAAAGAVALLALLSLAVTSLQIRHCADPRTIDVQGRIRAPHRPGRQTESASRNHGFRSDWNFWKASHWAGSEQHTSRMNS